jgi:hypothetical protein
LPGDQYAPVVKLSPLLFGISEGSTVSNEKITALDDILNFRIPARTPDENLAASENLLTSQANWATMPPSPKARKSKFQENGHGNDITQSKKRQKTIMVSPCL